MLNDAFIESVRVQFEAHPIYAAVSTLDDLRVFMQHHAHLDEDFHAPLSLRQFATLYGGDAVKWREAEAAAEIAVNARILFWDGVLQALPSQHAQAA